jgi:hypothetical protein
MGADFLIAVAGFSPRFPPLVVRAGNGDYNEQKESTNENEQPQHEENQRP